MTEHPPGWHPDPHGRHEHRYWDGTTWTDHVSDGGVTSQDDFNAAEAKIDAPIGPSMVNLPAIDPALLQQQVSQPAPSGEPAEPQPAAAGHRAQAGPEDALERASDALESAAASLAHRPVSLAGLLTLVAPGAGHLYLGVAGVRRTIGLVLLALTVAAIVLDWVMFPIGLILFVLAAVYAFFDLRGELAPLAERNSASGPLAMFSDLGSALAWRLVIVGGALLAISLVLPWYHLSVDLGGAGSVSANASGFDAFGIIDLVLLAVGVGSVVLGVMNLREGTTKRPVSTQLATLVAAAGAACLLLVTFRILFVPDAGLEFDIGRAVGTAIAFAGAATVAAGGAGAAAARE